MLMNRASPTIRGRSAASGMIDRALPVRLSDLEALRSRPSARDVDRPNRLSALDREPANGNRGIPPRPRDRGRLLSPHVIQSMRIHKVIYHIASLAMRPEISTKPIDSDGRMPLPVEWKRSRKTAGPGPSIAFLKVH
jgi:hypothetical protein